MMLLALLAATAAGQAPVVGYAEARSAAYRDCVAAQHRRKPDLSIAQIGRGPCAGPRARLVSAARSHVAYGWVGVPKTANAAKRLKAQHKVNAEAEVVRFEAELRAWLKGTEGDGGGPAAIQGDGRAQ